MVKTTCTHVRQGETSWPQLCAMLSAMAAGCNTTARLPSSSAGSPVRVLQHVAYSMGSLSAHVKLQHGSRAAKLCHGRIKEGMRRKAKAFPDHGQLSSLASRLSMLHCRPAPKALVRPWPWAGCEAIHTRGAMSALLALLLSSLATSVMKPLPSQPSRKKHEKEVHSMPCRMVEHAHRATSHKVCNFFHYTS